MGYNDEGMCGDDEEQSTEKEQGMTTDTRENTTEKKTEASVICSTRQRQLYIPVLLW